MELVYIQHSSSPMLLPTDIWEFVFGLYCDFSLWIRCASGTRVQSSSYENTVIQLDIFMFSSWVEPHRSWWEFLLSCVFFAAQSAHLSFPWISQADARAPINMPGNLDYVNPIPPSAAASCRAACSQTESEPGRDLVQCALCPGFDPPIHLEWMERKKYGKTFHDTRKERKRVRTSNMTVFILFLRVIQQAWITQP